MSVGSLRLLATSSAQIYADLALAELSLAADDEIVGTPAMDMCIARAQVYASLASACAISVAAALATPARPQPRPPSVDQPPMHVLDRPFPEMAEEPS